jgi:hypothetical protein
MKYSLLLLLMLCLGSAFAQTDSLTIKLEQYKQLFIKGLITANEYEALKAKVLQIGAKPANDDGGFVPDSNVVEHKETFNISVVPNFYFDVSEVTKQSGGRTYSTRGTGTLGLHIVLGPAVKKRFHPNVGFGVEGWGNKLRVPVYADFGMKILKTKISPYYHVSLGYMFLRGYNAGLTRNDALLTGAGFGFSIYAAKNFAVSLSGEYRMLFYANYEPTSYDALTHSFLKSSMHHFIHQAGVRLLLTFY